MGRKNEPSSNLLRTVTNPVFLRETKKVVSSIFVFFIAFQLFLLISRFQGRNMNWLHNLHVVTTGDYNYDPKLEKFNIGWSHAQKKKSDADKEKRKKAEKLIKEGKPVPKELETTKYDPYHDWRRRRALLSIEEEKNAPSRGRKLLE